MLDIVYEDHNLIIVNKPKNLSCHISDSNSMQLTLEHIIQNHHPLSVMFPRSGIVHRLDKDTTGLLIVGKSLQVIYDLQKQFAMKTISRRYYGLVHKKPPTIQGVIQTYLLMSYPSCKTQVLAVRDKNDKAKFAKTYYYTIKCFSNYSLLRFNLHTGRTHQIRAHANFGKFPLVGDKKYSNYNLKSVTSQLLHAYNLCFNYQGQHFDIYIDLPKEFLSILDTLNANEQHIIP